ncbi:TetR/AcrR family transcriptional regulator [Reticulibacter mediterranei]|uniref:TetR/AcrR family transcriptional regulator n=1 Tax=Reticulibacter mediterranei TaxID=2778369 RepID=UPI001F33B0D5|nr:helix-turn-helix domain-containing protein [Reticulibacter mediterranei]
MSQNSGDLRARRTRKLLRDALMALIEERGFDALTVGEIAARAMVSRAAFYRYYQDKYDLIEQIFEEEMQTLTRNLGSPRTISSRATIRSTHQRRRAGSVSLSISRKMSASIACSWGKRAVHGLWRRCAHQSPKNSTNVR